MKKTAKPPERDPVRAMLVQVAHLYYDENLSQQEIADRLEVSRSLIAQYLQRARDTGIVRIQIVDPNDACTDLAAALRKETGVKRVAVLPNPRGSQTLAFRAVAKAAAEFIADKLRDGDTLGLAWGRTTSMVVELLKPSHAHRIEVLPLMGECGHRRRRQNRRRNSFPIFLIAPKAHAFCRAHAIAHARQREFLLCWGKNTLPHGPRNFAPCAGDWPALHAFAYEGGGP